MAARLLGGGAAAAALTLRAALPRVAVAAPRWGRVAVGARGLAAQGEGVAVAAAAGNPTDAIAKPAASTIEVEAADASPNAEGADVTSCRAWVQSFEKHDPGDYHGFIPGQEKVKLTIDLSPMNLSTLEVGVMRGIVGDRFDPVLKKLRLSEDSHLTAEGNLEAAYAQARMLLGEVRRLAAEMAADSDLPRELLMKKLGGNAWCERTAKWIGESSDVPPSAPVPGMLTLHVGNLPRKITGNELQKKIASHVAGPIAVSKKRRDVWARVTVRDSEDQLAAVEQALADVESKHPVRVSTWNH